jgi:hypothetical protein
MEARPHSAVLPVVIRLMSPTRQDHGKCLCRNSVAISLNRSAVSARFPQLIAALVNREPGFTAG